MRSPARKWTRSRSWALMKRWMPTTKFLEMGSMRAEEAKGWPLWPRKKPTTPPGYMSRGW